jgi:SNF2 family DNA or RNA helicase
MIALTEATAKLLKPLNIQPNDRLSLILDGDKFVAEIFTLKADGTRTFASFQARTHFPARVPERVAPKHHGNRFDTWAFGATDTTAQIIYHLWKPEQLIFVGKDAQVTYEYLCASSFASDRISEIIANYTENKSVPKHALAMHPEQPLTPYQQVAASCGTLAEGFGLFMEQGTGKTPTSISCICTDAIRINARQNRMHRTLIVCPKNVRLNWIDEFEKFANIPGRATILRGDNIDRIKLLIDALSNPNGNGDKYTAVIISYEIMSRMLEALKTIEWDMMILDESHSIKSTTTKRAKSAHVLRDVAAKRLVLTGSPVGNSILDLYSQLEFINKGASGFTTWKAFKEFYGIYIQDESTGGFEKLVGIQNLPFMKERLARYTYIISKKQALPELPDKVYDVLECGMSPEQSDAYESLRDTLMAEIEHELDTSGQPQAVTINNALTKLLRLAQITSGHIGLDAVYAEDGTMLIPKRIKYFAQNPKLDALVEALKSKGPNSKSIVWACWTADIQQITERLEREGIDAVTFYGGTNEAQRAEAVRRFNFDRACRVIICNPAAGGTGVNLLGYPPGAPEGYDTNCDQEYFYSQNWSHLTRAQAEDRAHRIGTRQNLQITDLCVPGTIDEEIRVRVLKKKQTAMEISDIREILKTILKGGYKDE